jgi:hypothetical protein
MAKSTEIVRKHNTLLNKKQKEVLRKMAGQETRVNEIKVKSFDLFLENNESGNVKMKGKSIPEKT